MPIYAYRCRQCGQEFEELILSPVRAGQVRCPTCQSGELERRPTLFGLGGQSREVATAGGGCRPAAGGG